MSVLAQRTVSTELRQAIVRYLIDNVDSPCVSLSEIIRAVRNMFPLCELTDWELGDHIARSAIDAGFAIEFDADVP
ncbi:hypothetical protein FJ960_20685 [Mesorhizobium sp. B2-3-11]|uniref:hypothetical protein n=1 Tax=Mesorhizobium sp. B2-3-11 TaxID=2589953 RepID=UPI00112952BC|nr:hypothetical protein [Mesorhizobium sp. B2-3-11]TPL99856.1 hypothetical protein FJ960_20685 [Mesorhizobium sp. B2-3-11]